MPRTRTHLNTDARWASVAFRLDGMQSLHFRKAEMAIEPGHQYDSQTPFEASMNPTPKANSSAAFPQSGKAIESDHR